MTGVNLFDDLNVAQKSAVAHTEGPLLILAGAGSGKTRVVAHRTANLLANGVCAENILAITFTNKAANEMKERISALSPQGKNVWVSTFHSLCAAILRNDISHLGYTADFSIYDAQDAKTVLNEYIKRLNLKTNKNPHSGGAAASADKTHKMYAAAISRHKSALRTPRNVLDQGEPGSAEEARLYALYQKHLKVNNALDFDDLILFAYRLFKKFPDVCEKYQDRFLYISVDEFQDTNTAQFRFVSLLARKNRNLCVVGDDDQSIYGWRGANVENIYDFKKHFPDARIIKLEQNYRSTQTILDCANAVISHNKGRMEKRLFCENGRGAQITVYSARSFADESRFVATEIKKAVAGGASYSDFAVLYRANAQSFDFENAFLEHAVPYDTVGSIKFYARREIKDLLAFLKALANPSDNLSFERAISVQKGIGAVTVSKIKDFAAAGDICLSSAAFEAAFLANAKIKAFAGVWDALTRMAKTYPVARLIDEIIKRLGYTDIMRSYGEANFSDRAENVETLIQTARDYDAMPAQTGLAGFLQNVSLMLQQGEAEAGGARVLLMTLHSAKGLEFPVVFISGSSRFFINREKALKEADEERRLFYVGITRAKEKLYLTAAADSFSINRFFREVPPRLTSPLGAAAAKTRERQAGFRKLDFSVGDIVTERRYGRGEVLWIEPVGPDFEVTVKFDEAGVKKFMAALSRLQKV